MSYIMSAPWVECGYRGLFLHVVHVALFTDAQASLSLPESSGCEDPTLPSGGYPKPVKLKI